jgi:purine-binding chemotaxis protein CheW
MASSDSGKGSALKAALERSGERPMAATAQPDVEVFSFRIRQTRFGVLSGYVSEVVRLPPVTSLPGSPPFLLGVAAHRGEVIPVLDLSRFLGMGTTGISGRTRSAIARAEGMVLLLVADQLEGLHRIPAASLMPPPLGGEGPVEFFSSVVSDARGTLSILDLPRLLSSARARVVQ